MTSRLYISPLHASEALSSEPVGSGPHPSLSDKVLSTSLPSNVWVDPASLPNCGDISTIAGNAPDYVKQLNNNTFASYGVGNEDCFAHVVGKTVKFVEVNVRNNSEWPGRSEATTVAEVVVTKRKITFNLFMPFVPALTPYHDPKTC
jgi:acyl-coenzyme A thioesterase 13